MRKWFDEGGNTKTYETFGEINLFLYRNMDGKLFKIEMSKDHKVFFTYFDRDKNFSKDFILGFLNRILENKEKAKKFMFSFYEENQRFLPSYSSSPDKNYKKEIVSQKIETIVSNDWNGLGDWLDFILLEGLDIQAELDYRQGK